MKKWGMDAGFLRSAAVLLILGMTVGAMVVNAMADSSAGRAGILSNYFLRQYKYLEIDMSGLFLYILGKRMKWVFLLWIAGFTVIGIPCAAVYVTWMGFAAGVLFGIAVLKLGAQGILFSAAALLPQCLLYVPAWMFFLNGIYVWNSGRGGERLLGSGNGTARYFLLAALTCLLMALGILAESSLNPWLMKQVLRIL